MDNPDDERTFRYVAHPDRCALTVDDETTACGLCGDAEEITYAGGQFFGDDEDRPVCIACVHKGLPGDLRMRRDGDLGALRDQVRQAHPEWTAAQLQADEAEKLRVLVKQTPPITSWQAWFWPACCGDFCRFERHAGQKDLHPLARDRGLADGRALLELALVDEVPPAERVWGLLPAGHVFAGSNDGVQAYVFECRVCARLLVLWDAC